MSYEAAITLSRKFDSAQDALAALAGLAHEAPGLDGFTIDALNVYPRGSESAPPAPTQAPQVVEPAAPVEPSPTTVAATTEEPQASEATVEQPAPAPAVDPTLTDEAARDLAQEKAKAGHRAAVRDAIKATGVDAISAIPQDKRAEFRATLEAL